jgi:2-amino-4-hydroxy-6-hydroxymethyldihydropteridine diphosphokinase
VSSAPDGPRAGETLALVAIGANLGDRLATMRAAVDQLARVEGVRVLEQSSVYDTAPVGPPDQPRYLNAAVSVATTLGPQELLVRLLAIEATLGRERDGTRWTARTIDLDLVLFGECVLDEGDLQVPHPRFRERAFVLLPLTEIARNSRDPVTGERLESLLRACPGRSDAVRVGPLDSRARA